MEFTLVYRGPLKANGNTKHKQCIRRVIHAQLKELMNVPHMQKAGPPDELVTIGYDERGLICVRNVGDFEFAGLVNEEMHLVAELSIILLRPEASGVIVTRGGDIDNRLKTLLDSLRMPQKEDELPKSDSPKKDEKPFYCLLEDDKLITRLDIISDRLLEPRSNPADVNLMIRVRMKPTQITCANIRFLQ